MDLERLKNDKLAIVAITKEASKLALKLAKLIGSANKEVYLAQNVHSRLLEDMPEVKPFKKVSSLFKGIWQRCNVIVCIMATGIVVRSIAPLIDKKDTDPAIIVLDEKGRFAISLLSGHIGGANDWARYIANLLGATAVITTSSDVQEKVALDLVAKRKGLIVAESYNDLSPNLATVMRSLLDGEPLWIFDPERRIFDELIKHYPSLYLTDRVDPNITTTCGIWVSEQIPPTSLSCLRLHPRNLLVGVGCNRGTSAREIIHLIKDVFCREGLFLGSIQAIVSVEIKQDEKGLKEAAEALGVPLLFVSKDKLKTISVPNPSLTVEKHIGVKGVCEAAPIAIIPSARLIIPKSKSLNVTVSVARVPFQS